MRPYLLFHGLVEIAAATVAFGTFLFAWNTRRFQNGLFRVIGPAALFVGLLALVRSLAELHGGTASAASDGLDQGAEFEVRLPLPARAALVAAAGEGVAS